MDPVACWKKICKDMKDPDKWEDAMGSLDDLCGWMERGGYRPDDVPFCHQLRGFQRVMEAIQRENNFHVNPDL